MISKGVIMKRLFLFICAIFLCLPACSQTGSVSNREFNVAISNGIPMLHPHISFNADEAQILTALYEGFFVYDPYTLQPMPALAEQWTHTDGRIWRFTIKENAKFENGDPITAQTFADSWFNLLTPGAGFEYSSLLDFIDGAADYRTGKLKNKNQVGIKAESERVFAVYTNMQAEHLPSILCHHAFSAVHPSQLKNTQKLSKSTAIKNAKSAFKPLSSGPYKIEKFTEKEIILTKNENYWDTNSVEISKINLLLNLTKEQAAEKFNKGEIDWLSRSDVIPKIGDQRNIRIDPMFATEFFFFKTSAGISRIKEIREALLLAVPYEELREGYLIKASTLIFPLAGYPAIKGIGEYNIQKAEEIINKLGLTKSEKKIVIKVPDLQYYKDLISILNKAWEKIGITCEAKFFPFSSYYNELKSSDYNLGIISWIGDFADPLAFLEIFQPESTLNDSDWNNREFEQTLKKAAADAQIKSRFEKLSTAEELLLKDCVIIPLSHQVSVNIIDLFSIEGWYSNAINIHPFKFIKFVRPQPLPDVARI